MARGVNKVILIGNVGGDVESHRVGVRSRSSRRIEMVCGIERLVACEHHAAQRKRARQYHPEERGCLHITPAC